MAKVTITKLYDLLSNSMGKEAAENLTTFIEEKIRTEVDSNFHILATKADLQREVFLLKEDLTKEIYVIKEDLNKEISSVKEDLNKEISSVKEDLNKHILLLKEQLNNQVSLLKDDIKKVDLKITDSKSETIKWMFIFWVGQVVTTFGFILLFLKK